MRLYQTDQMDPVRAQRQRVAWEKEPRRNERAFGIAGSEGYDVCDDALRDRIIELKGKK